MLHVPEIVFFSQSIKRWHLVTVSRQRARSGVILDNCLPASSNAVFMVVSGRRLNSLCIYVRSHKLQKITKSETFKWFCFQLLAIDMTHFTFPPPWHGRNLSIFQGCIFFCSNTISAYFKTPSSAMGAKCQKQIQNWQYYPFFKLRFKSVANIFPLTSEKKILFDFKTLLKYVNQRL